MTKTQYQTVFEFFDTDKSGYISASELKDAIGACGQKVDDQVLRKFLQEDGFDGQQLSYERFATFLQTLESKALSYEDINQLFKTLDVDCSGYLSAAEIRHFMTNMNLCGGDAVVDEMVSLYDLDGNGQITIEEFLTCLKNMGYRIEEGVEASLHDRLSRPDSSAKVAAAPVNKAPVTSKMFSTLDFPKEMQDVLSMFDFGSEHQVGEDDLKRAAELLKMEKLKGVQDPETNPTLHWTPGRTKIGLGPLVFKANHIALIVSDVGRSASFYTNIMGFQQIRRPNFDRHGAWFTMGNLELHLIKGKPVVHDGDDLVVGHISIETFDIDRVPTILRQLGVPFRQNVSVPSAADAGDAPNVSNSNSNIVRQYFIRDPDGYYIEICNCDILTRYCLGEKEELAGYEEGVKPMGAESAARIITFMHKWTGIGEQIQHQREALVEKARATDGSIAAYAELLEYVEADEVNEEKLHNLVVRRAVYGDICQNESEQDLALILKCSGNDVPKADNLMKLRAEAQCSRKVTAPGFYEDGTTFIKPPEKQLHDGL